MSNKGTYERFCGVRVPAFCVMSNHFHIMLEIPAAPEERFKSVLVENGHAARTTAAYIDLNPVRAGMVDDPEDYHWCRNMFSEGRKSGARKMRGITPSLQAMRDLRAQPIRRPT